MIPYGFSFGLIEIHNQVEHIGADGKHYLVTHGDLFDSITRLAPWLVFLGDKAYDFMLSFNTKFNWLRHRMGFGYWSLSQYLKQRVKKAVDFIFRFEKNLAAYCKKRGYDGVIAGHIHNPEIKLIDGIWYFNDGDFVESVSALVETHEGDWILIHLEENQWRPFQVLDRQTNQILRGELCVPWFEQKGFSVLQYQDLDSK
jgi:UDP-2,3-diacylglucosamine pyrophosphatase LpxH